MPTTPQRSIVRALILNTVLASSVFAAANQVIEVYNPAGIREDGTYVDKLLKTVMAATGKTRPPLAGEFPEEKTEKITIVKDAFAEVNDLSYKRGWGDGLPIVPPTSELVKEMLRSVDMPAEKVIASAPPKGGQATVEKIAVNAVMAGCRPEYMPVLIAAVEAVSDPEFNLSCCPGELGDALPTLPKNGY